MASLNLLYLFMVFLLVQGMPPDSLPIHLLYRLHLELDVSCLAMHHQEYLCSIKTWIIWTNFESSTDSNTSIIFRFLYLFSILLTISPIISFPFLTRIFIQSDCFFNYFFLSLHFSLLLFHIGSHIIPDTLWYISVK